MFRRLSSSLPQDPSFPADLEKLGYFINDADQIRSIKDPEIEFHYFISKNERVLQVHREAYDTCVRNILAARFSSIGLQTIRLPLGAGPEDANIPILATPNLPTAKRIIIYLGEIEQDLGVFSHRSIKDSLATGSCLKFVTDAMAQGSDVAVVIANLGQTLWYWGGRRALTWKSWNALPRKTAVNPGLVVGPGNKVPGHENAEAHVVGVMDSIRDVMSSSAKVELIALCEGAEFGIRYLNEKWDKWNGSIACMAVGLGYIWDLDTLIDREELKDFVGKRARAYLIHQEPLNTPLSGRKQMGCNTFSSGEAQYTECIMPQAYTAMLNFFKLIKDEPDYKERPSLADLSDDEDEEEDADGLSRDRVTYLPGSGAAGAAAVSFSMPARLDPV